MEGIEDRVEGPHDVRLRPAQRGKTECCEFVLK
jgi:hypothetical protein